MRPFWQISREARKRGGLREILFLKYKISRLPVKSPERVPQVAAKAGLGDGSTMEEFGGAPLARQMAKLLASSDLDELQEVVKRWLAEAPTERVRRQYEAFGQKLVELKRALASAPQQPSEEELELALTMMLKLAAQGPGER
jgi:hypothetical protein